LAQRQVRLLSNQSQQPSNAFLAERCCRRLASMQSYQSPRRLSPPFPTVREVRMPIGSGPPSWSPAADALHRPTSQTGGSPRRALGSGPSKLRECPPPHLRDPHAGDFHRASTRDHALGPCSRHPGADEINKEIGREPVRKHDRLAAAVGGCGEQFERAAAIGLRAAPAARIGCWHRALFVRGGGPARWVVSCAYIRWTPWPSKTRLQRST